MIVNSAKIKWLESGFPFSEDYNDRYFSDENPIEESKHVFLRANDLESRWASLEEERFIISELGFGFGLNFILSSQLWQLSALPEKRLHYIAFEKNPPTREQFNKFYSKLPKLSNISEKLCEKLPNHTSGCHRINFSESIILDLHYGDIKKTLKNIYNKDGAIAIDTWYIDGFSPSCNSAIWEESICKMIGELSKEKTTLSSYTSAGHFRRAIENNGFSVEKIPGYGLKRHMIAAKYAANITKDYITLKEKKDVKKSIGIIGAGIAGCATAYSLAKRGFKVKVFDSDPRVANQASGIPLLALRPRLFQSESSISEYFLHSFLFSAAQFSDLSKHRDIGWKKINVFQLNNALNKRRPMNIEKISSIYSSDILKTFNSEESADLSGMKLSEGGLIFPHGGMIKPDNLCEFYLNSPRITVSLNTPITKIKYINNKWTLYSTENNPQTDVDTIIIANSFCLDKFIQTEHLPIIKTSGTVTWFPYTTFSKQLKAIICGKKTVFPAHVIEPNKHLVAASYEKDGEILSTTNATQENYEGAIQNFTRMDVLENKHQGNVTGIRCNTPDRIPYIGKIPNYEVIKQKRTNIKYSGMKLLELTEDCYWPDLYITTAHGSNGAATSPFSAEVLASMINKEPSPIDSAILDSINPSRVLIRDLKRRGN